MVELEPPRRFPRVPLTVNGPETARVEVAVVLRTPPFPYTTPERAPSTGALVKRFNVPEKVLESVRRVEEAARPLVASVVPLKVRPEPMMREERPPVVFPTRIPPRVVVEPVPPND